MSRVKSNFVYNAIYQVLVLIIPFITTPYVARVVGVDGVGIYSYTYSIVHYFMMFALLGMNSYGNREVSKIKEDKEKLNRKFSEIYYLQLMITLLTLIVYIMYLIFFSQKYLVIGLIQIMYVASVAFDINWLFCGLQKFKFVVTRSGIIKLLTLVLIFVFVKDSNDLWKYVCILASTTLLNQVILWPFLKKEVKFVKVDFKSIFKHLKPTLILFVPIIATSIFKVMDKIMIGNISGVTQVGYYENAEKILKIIISIVSALGTVTLPQMTYLYAKNKLDEFYNIFYKSIKFIYFLVFPIIFGFLIVGNDFVVWYLGDSYLASSDILKILCVSLLFSPFADIVRMQLLIPRNKDKEYIISVVVGAIINFVLNLILIPRFDAIGAAIATVVAEMLVCFTQIYFIRKDIKFSQEKSFFLTIFIKSFIMFVVVFFVGRKIDGTFARLVVQVGVGIIIYFCLNFKYINELIDIKKYITKFKNRTKK